MKKQRQLNQFRLSVDAIEPDDEPLAGATPIHCAPDSVPTCEQYDLLSLLGQGGMGKVYRARSKELGTEVAIKVIHPSLVADPACVKRFEQEARAASSLTHANLVAVYDYGKTSIGTPFLVMDLLDGVSLADVIKSEGFLDVERALDLFLQICDALIHAHMKGVVHRDLKPSNVFLTKSEDGIELVKIIDFGIAKLLAKTESSITQTGDVFGSPAYMSPEQCLGLETDARSDVYSLGCIMYECLTGHLPFSGDNPIQTIVKHINEQPVLFGKDCNDLSISDSLQGVILNTLEKDKAKRYQTMDELRADLERIRDGLTPLRARFSEKKEKKSKPKFTAKTVVGVLCIVISGVAASIFGFDIGLQNASVLPLIPSLAPTARLAPQSVPIGDLRPVQQFELLDIHNRLLYRSEKSHDIGEAVNEAILKDIDLSNLNLSGRNLEKFYLTTVGHQAKLVGADFSHSQFGNSTSFFNVDLSGANFTGAIFKSLQLNDCTAVGASFRDVRLDRKDNRSNVDFSEANLTAADFTGASLPGCWFHSILTNAKFSNGNFDKGEFSFQNLTGADFTGASLKEANFGNAILSKAKFAKADLTGASIDGCIGADFAGADTSVARHWP